MDSQDNDRFEATFQLKIEGFSKMKDQVLSSPTIIRNLPWKIMAMPRMCQQAGPDRQIQKSLGFFLQCNGDDESATWSCNAEFELRLLSQKKGVETIRRKMNHVFYNKENDWGFSHFYLWNDIVDPQKGYIQDDTVILEAWVLPDAYDNDRSEATFQFKIEGFSKMKDQVLSSPTIIRNLPWKIMAMPRMSQQAGHERQAQKSLGFFLQCNGDNELPTWSCNAKAELRLVPQKEGVGIIKREINHVFFNKENDWGFSHFHLWNDIIDPKKGFIKDDTIILEVWVSTGMGLGYSI